MCLEEEVFRSEKPKFRGLKDEMWAERVEVGSVNHMLENTTGE